MNIRRMTGTARVVSVRKRARLVLGGLVAVATLVAGPAMAVCNIVDLGALGGGLSAGANAINDSNQVVGLAIFCSNCGVHAFLAQQGKAVKDLGSLAGRSGGSIANDINNSSVVVGYSTTKVSGVSHAFRWTSQGGMKDLGTLGGNGSSSATDINNLGQIVGSASTPAGTFIQDAFLWTNGVMQDLGSLAGLGSGANAINEVGHVVGRSEVAGGTQHAFLWTPAGGMIDLGTLGGTTSEAVDINDNDEITGWSYTPTLATHGFRWANGVMTDLGTLAGGDRTLPKSINNNSQIVGFSDTSRGSSPFFWSAACGILDLTPFATGTANGINGAGNVVGTVNVSGFQPAAVWPVGSGCSVQETDLPSLGGGRTDQGKAINTNGVMGGTSFDFGNTIHAVIWTGCP